MRDLAPDKFARAMRFNGFDPEPNAAMEFRSVDGAWHVPAVLRAWKAWHEGGDKVDRRATLAKVLELRTAQDAHSEAPAAVTAGASG